MTAQSLPRPARPHRALLGITSALVLSGCAHSPSSPAEPPPVTASVAAPSGTPAASPPTSTDPSTEQAPTTPASTPAARSAALAAATGTMRAYLTTGRSAASWLAGLDPHLAQDDAAAAAGTDPLLIPAHRITGPATLAGAATATAAVVAVPTDAGTYRLLVVREPVGVWLTAHVTVPTGTH